MAGLDIEKEMHFGKIDFYAWIEPWKNVNFTSDSIGVLREVCIMRSDHPVVHDKLTTELYASLKHLVLKLPSQQATSAIDRELWARGIKREHDMTIHTYFNAPLILASTDLICSMPLELAKHFAQRYPLKIVPSPVARDLSAFLTWHNSMKDDPGHIWMRNTLAQISKDALKL
jgi:DNA-binding transcriptional LysR family regulator